MRQKRTFTGRTHARHLVQRRRPHGLGALGAVRADREHRNLVDRFGIQVVLYVTMWIALLATVLVSLLLLGPQACIEPVKTYDPRFDQPPQVE